MSTLVYVYGCAPPRSGLAAALAGESQRALCLEHAETLLDRSRPHANAVTVALMRRASSRVRQVPDSRFHRSHHVRSCGSAGPDFGNSSAASRLFGLGVAASAHRLIVDRRQNVTRPSR